MMKASPHPRFRDVLWDFIRADPSEDMLRLRMCGSDEELFEREESDEGIPWTVPRGVVPPRNERRRIEPLDLPAASHAGQRLWMSMPELARNYVLQPGALPLRLRISGELKEVRYLPWECLPLPPDGIVCRSVPVPYPVPPAVVREPPLRVLVVVTNPKDERLLDPYRELAAIQMPAVGYTREVVSEPTLAGLRRELKRVEPHIVHYVGHSATSGGQGYLVLHDSSAHTHWISARELATILPSTVRLICLSTCFTAENYDVRGLPLFAQAPSDASLPSVVGNRLPLTQASEPAIRSFWQTFYTELFNQQGDTSTAFARAKQAIRPSNDWPSFMLVIRDGIGWGFALSSPAQALAAPAPVEPPAVLKMKEFDALYSNSIANYLTQQTSLTAAAVRSVLRDHSRIEAERAQEALSKLPGFEWPGKDRS